MRTLLITLLAFTTLNAQEFKPQKVTAADLEQKVYPKDTSAVAVVLYEIGNSEFEYNQHEGFQLKTKGKVRIKIYKKEGYQFANCAMTYFSNGGDREVLYFSDAVTYNLENGKIVKTKLKPEGEFDEQINRFWGRKKITLPNVKEGSIIEYEYSIVSNRFGELPEWSFQSSIPTEYSSYEILIPEYLSYNANQKGYLPIETKSEKETKIIIIANKERSSQDKVDYVATRTSYVVRNAPAMRDESFVNNINNYRSAVSHELSMTKWPNSTVKLYSSDWASVTKTIYGDDNFGAELNKTGYFEDDLKALMAGLVTPSEKIAAVFNHVKSSVKWNEYFGYSCSDGVRKAYKDKTGNVAEVNLMLTAMLRYAGFNANPVLVSTRSNGISFFPNRTAFNYVISAVELNGDVVLLDATSKYSTPNILPLRDLNWNGRLIRKDGSSTEVPLMAKGLSKSVISMMYGLNEKGEVDGKFRKQMTDHVALSFRDNNLKKNQEQYLEDLENSSGKIEITAYNRENDLDLLKPVSEAFSFHKGSAADVIGDKMYFHPLLFLADDENPFKLEKREYPIDFGYPTEYKYNITIDLPAGYAVESLPTSVNLNADDGTAVFKFIIANAGNKLQLNCTATFSEAIVSADRYDVLKGFFGKMVEKENEKIVLKKI